MQHHLPKLYKQLGDFLRRFNRSAEACGLERCSEASNNTVLVGFGEIVRAVCLSAVRRGCVQYGEGVCSAKRMCATQFAEGCARKKPTIRGRAQSITLPHAAITIPRVSLCGALVHNLHTSSRQCIASRLASHGTPSTRTASGQIPVSTHQIAQALRLILRSSCFLPRSVAR